MKKIGIVSALLLSLPAWAGMKGYAAVQVNLSSRSGSGSMGDARNSEDSVSFIGCYTVAHATSVFGICEARDAQSETLQCSTTAAPMIAAIQAISDGAWIWFEADANGNCTFISTGRFSYHQPPQP